jgi:hypothetical protein
VKYQFVYNDNKLSDIFGNKKCLFAGTILDSSKTFGDYQISKFIL